MTGQLTHEERRAALLAALSPRQHAVIVAVLSGQDDRRASSDLGMTIHTFRTQLARAASKLGLTGARRSWIFALFLTGTDDLPIEAIKQ